MKDILEQLAEILEERKGRSPDASYVASLYRDGLDAILEKIREESSEVMDAARHQGKEALVHEVADLWFHTLVLLAHSDLSPEAVLDELERRFGTSGLDEKAGR